MDFLSGKIKTLYFKYLAAAFGSALITSIYSIVDMAMVGQYHGPEGTAALAVVAPIWNIIYSMGLLMGIGGSVLFSTIRGKGDGQTRLSNEYFTVSVLGSAVLAIAAWIVIVFFDRQLLQFFGADGTTLSLWPENTYCPLNLWFPVFFSPRCWPPICETTKIRLWPLQEYWPVEFSTYSATISLSSPAIWELWVQVLPQQSAR